MLCVGGALGLGGHVVIGVEPLVSRFHHADVIPSVEFFPFGCCSSCGSQTVLCVRQFHLWQNYCTLLHREHESFEVLSLHDEDHLGKSYHTIDFGLECQQNRTHRIGLSMIELFRKINEDFGRSIS